MKPLFLAIILLTGGCLSSHASASPLDDKVQAFKAAIKDEIATEPNRFATEDVPLRAKSVAAAYNDTGSLMASLDQLPKQMGNPNDVHNVEIQIRQLLSAFTKPTVQKAGQDLLDEISQLHKASDDAVTAKVQALLKRVSDEIGTAKKAADLDGLIADLQKFLSDRYGFNAENPQQYQKVSAAFDFAKLWQSFLFHSNSGDAVLAANDLRSIDQGNEAVGVVPRSQILERLAAATSAIASTTPAAVTILKNIKSLDEMEPALKQLSQLPQNDSITSRATNNLAPLVQLYTSTKTGLPQTINFNFISNTSDVGVSPAIQTQLLNFVLQRYFEYKGTPPAADEAPGAFVDRVITDAITHENWTLLRRAVSGEAYLNRNSALALGTTNNLAAGMDDLLAGINQETASQYALAVVSYQKALKVSDTTLPAKWLGTRLAAIEKDHPDEYKQGMEIAIASPADRRFPSQPTAPPAPPASPPK